MICDAMKFLEGNNAKSRAELGGGRYLSHPQSWQRSAVFGQRQDRDGAYAAVIPKWVAAMLKGETIYINGTGETSRDFCYVKNVIQANILAATSENDGAANQVYNVAVNARTDLLQLFEMLRSGLVGNRPELAGFKPVHRDFRAGDVLHSQADVSKAGALLGYEPTYTIQQGLAEALEWYVGSLSN